MGCMGSNSNYLYYNESDRIHFYSIGLTNSSIRKYLHVFLQIDSEGLLYINMMDLLVDWSVECNFVVLNMFALIGIHKHLSMNFREVCDIDIFYTSYCSSFILISNLI